jgi:hypothetical protein
MTLAQGSNNAPVTSIGGLLAILAIILGGSALTVSFVFVFWGCEFVHIKWEDDYYDEQNHSFATTTGVAHCKVFGLWSFGGPTNGIDSLAAWGSFLAPIAGLCGIINLSTSFWKCCCNCCCSFSLKTVAAMFGAAFIAQILTLLVLVAPACSDEYNGECTLLWNGWVSIGASIAWFLCTIAVLKIPSPAPQPPATTHVGVGTLVPVSDLTTAAAEEPHHTSNAPPFATATPY